jgi:hypothetical protein
MGSAGGDVGNGMPLGGMKQRLDGWGLEQRQLAAGQG